MENEEVKRGVFDSSSESFRASLRRHRFALAFIALVATLLFIAPLAKREVFTLRDHHDYFQPLRWFTATELRAGRLPLWNPYNLSGEPWLANPQTGVFYPPAWIFLALPFATAYMLFLLFHLVLLGWGAYLLFARSVSPRAALVGAVALMLSGPVLSLLDVNNNLASLAWIPLVLWCAAEGAWRRGAVALALAFLAGEPFFAALAAAMYAVTLLANGRGRWSKRALQLALTAIFAVGLSAIQLFPFLRSIQGSDRFGGMEPTQVLSESMPLRDWVSTFWPLDRPTSQEFIPNVYMGVVVVLLSLVGIVMGIASRKRRDVVGWVALLLFAVAIAAGPEWLARLPLTLFRYPARLIPLASLAVAALAAAGWERIRFGGRWTDLILLLIVIVDLVPRARPLLISAPFRTHPVPYDASIGARSKFLRFGKADPGRRDAWIAGYLNLYDRRFDAFTPAPLANERYVRFIRKVLETPSFEELALGGIGFVLSDRALPPPFQPLVRDESVIVYGNDTASPMASLLWREPPTMRPLEWSLDTSHARVSVNAPHDGIVVLRQRAARGWRVEVDGKPAQSLVVDEMFRGVDVAAGRHEIVWAYRPRSFLVGSIVTLVALLGVMLSNIFASTKFLNVSTREPS